MPDLVQLVVKQGVSRANVQGPFNHADHARSLVGEWHERVPMGHETGECWLPLDFGGEDIGRSGP